MTKSIAAAAAAAIIGALACAPFSAAAATADKAALQKATADCKAQVKGYAKYHETSWYARHKMVKICVADAMAKRQRLKRPPSREPLRA
jgi:hypothetical protein